MDLADENCVRQIGLFGISEEDAGVSMEQGDARFSAPLADLPMSRQKPTFYEFFAGGGMARAGLGSGWRCLFANDFDAKKAVAYRNNWRGDDLREGDIRDVKVAELPGEADLAWASFPCQDLSLAGNGAGLSGERSGNFWKFWDLMKRLRAEGRAPKVIALENVVGALSSHDGKDFAGLAGALCGGGYTVGALVMDAVEFLPQSRPRLFIVALDSRFVPPEGLMSGIPLERWHPAHLRAAQAKLSGAPQSGWVWWALPEAEKSTLRLRDIIEDQPAGVVWHSEAETERLLGMMSAINLGKVREAQKARQLRVGTIYRRTRRNEEGEREQRAEVRFDDVAGCLRTPAGGSSRQTLIFVEGQRIRTRLLSPREAARLMGLPDSYLLPSNYNEAYHLAGDGVAVPVVRFLAEHLLEPLVKKSRLRLEKSAVA
jgi:DNA (cytosine-5)-methyltransferase 1